MHDHDHHEHECGCGCHGDHHHHDHHEHHEHDEHCGCGCGHDHDHEHVEIQPVEGMSILQQNMLLALYERRFLPVARFGLAKEGEASIQATALAPVYLGTPKDTMEQVKSLGDELAQLEAGGLITLDYDLPLGGYPYTEYKEAELYAYFVKTVQEAASKPGHVFDTPVLELGSMALTDAGEAAVEAMLP